MKLIKICGECRFHPAAFGKHLLAFRSPRVFLAFRCLELNLREYTSGGLNSSEGLSTGSLVLFFMDADRNGDFKSEIAADSSLDLGFLSNLIPLDTVRFLPRYCLLKSSIRVHTML